MSRFTLFIDPTAKADIQDAVSYYNSKTKDLGKKFHSEVKNAFKSLSNNPHFQIRYNHVRCLPLKKFPFLIHYQIDVEQNTITVYAVLHTSLDTSNWLKT